MSLHVGGQVLSFQVAGEESKGVWIIPWVVLIFDTAELNMKHCLTMAFNAEGGNAMRSSVLAEAEDTGAKLFHLWLTLRDVFLKFKRMVLQNHPALFIHFCVCMYVCMYICLYVWTYMFIYVYVQAREQLQVSFPRTQNILVFEAGFFTLVEAHRIC